MHYHDSSFSLHAKTQRQVELEDWVTWAQRDIEYPLSPLPQTKIVATPVAAYLFGLHIFKRTISIMRP